MKEPSKSPLLITNKDNIFYLTGFLTNYNREVFVVLSAKENLFITDGRIIDLVKGKISNKFTVVERSHSYPLSQILVDFLKKNKLKKLAYEKSNLTVLEYENLSKKLKGIKLIGTDNVIEKQRTVKNRAEINLIKKAAQITDKTFIEILPLINPDTKEKELVWKIKTIFNTYDGNAAFEPIVASGIGSSIPHYISQNKKVGNNTLILLDFGACYKGYCSDMTRVIFVGKPNTQIRNLYNSVVKAQEKALKSKTNIAKEIDKITRDSIIKDGFSSIPHGAGHGVGIAIHENPRLNPKSKDVLTKGMVFTIEPGIYIPNLGGVRIEDLVILSNSGIEVLSKTNKKLIEL